MSNILLINDMPGVGKVATAAMLPILSYMGHSVCNLPTALVSNTLDYGKFSILETTDYMQQVIPIWQQLGFEFNAIATGFIISEQQAKLVADYCLSEKKKKTKIFVDPIMGDNGSLYNGISYETVEMMKHLIAVADVCYPNYTEACFLTDTPFKDEGISEDEAKDLLLKLKEQGASAALITSVKVNGAMCVVGCSEERGNKDFFFLPYDEIPVRFPGTGDIFSAILMGEVMKQRSLIDSTQKAMNVVERLIKLNQHNEDKKRGIDIERHLADVL